MRRRNTSCGSAAWAAAGLTVIVLSGCGGVYDATVSGAVTLDGDPVPRGTVAYHPLQSGPSAYARIDDGYYTVHTGREVGLPPGEYQVTIISNEPPPVAQSAGGGPPPPGKPITPLWYRTKQTSGLKFTVEKGSNEIDLELSTQPPPGYDPRRRR